MSVKRDANDEILLVKNRRPSNQQRERLSFTVIINRKYYPFSYQLKAEYCMVLCLITVDGDFHLLLALHEFASLQPNPISFPQNSNNTSLRCPYQENALVN